MHLGIHTHKHTYLDILAISSTWISEGFCPVCSTDAQDGSWHGEVDRKQPMGDSDG